MAVYSAIFERTASATLAVGNINAAATLPRRFRLLDIMVGSDANPPADNALKFLIERCTTKGTRTTVTPNPMDAAEAAFHGTAGENHTANGTGGADLFTIPLNGKSTMRWVARPGEELIAAAVADDGLQILTPVAGGTPTVSVTIWVAE